MKKPKVALISLGCAKNLVDSEVMLGHLKRAGFRPVGMPGQADVLVVNTCGFIQSARDEADEHILQALELKKKDPSRKVAVVGCYVERDREALQARFSGIDVWLGVRDMDRIGDALSGNPFHPGANTFLYSHDSPRLVTSPGSWAYVKISEGCSRRCGFCSIPMIKGPYVSRTMASVEKEARALAELGVKEINLISHDSTFYGLDRGYRSGLTGLLRRLLGVPGLDWIRFLYGYPEEITDPLLDILTEKKICSYLDIPFQHSDPRLVRAMKRGMDGRRALLLLENIRRRIPAVAIRTSLIVGFPGEGKKEFESLKKFVREANFDHLGVFSYSSERGTEAGRLLETVDEAEKERRRGEIMAIQAGLSLRRNRGYLGKIHEVLIESRDHAAGRWIGRTRFQAPEVDGNVVVRYPRDSPGPTGPIIRVKITRAGVYDLHGRIVQ